MDHDEHEIVVFIDGEESFRIPGGDNELDPLFEDLGDALMKAYLDGLERGLNGLGSMMVSGVDSFELVGPDPSKSDT